MEVESGSGDLAQVNSGIVALRYSDNYSALVLELSSNVVS